MAVSEHDWLAVSRRAAERVRAELARFATAAERGVETGTGEGGDRTLVIDQAAEDAVLAELDALGTPMTVISEERGEVEARRRRAARRGRPGGWLAQRQARPALRVAVVAVANGPTLADVEFGTPRPSNPSWSGRPCAARGAFAGSERLPPLEPGPEILGLETARPELVAQAAETIARSMRAASGRSARWRSRLARGARRARRDAEPAPHSLGRRRSGRPARPRGRRQRGLS